MEIEDSYGQKSTYINNHRNWHDWSVWYTTLLPIAASLQATAYV